MLFKVFFCVFLGAGFFKVTLLLLYMFNSVCLSILIVCELKLEGINYVQVKIAAMNDTSLNSLELTCRNLEATQMSR